MTSKAKQAQQRRRGGTKRTRPDSGKGATPKPSNLTEIVRAVDPNLRDPIAVARAEVLKAAGFEGTMKEFVKGGGLPDGHTSFHQFYHAARGSDATRAPADPARAAAGGGKKRSKKKSK